MHSKMTARNSHPHYLHQLGPCKKFTPALPLPGRSIHSKMTVRISQYTALPPPGRGMHSKVTKKFTGSTLPLSDRGMHSKVTKQFTGCTLPLSGKSMYSKVTRNSDSALPPPRRSMQEIYTLRYLHHMGACKKFTDSVLPPPHRSMQEIHRLRYLHHI